MLVVLEDEEINGIPPLLAISFVIYWPPQRLEPSAIGKYITLANLKLLHQTQQHNK